MTNLPNLIQLVQALRRQNEEACRQDTWSSHPELGMVASVSKWSYPMKDFVNDADDIILRPMCVTKVLLCLEYDK